jgi:glutathione S-transferase
MTVLIFQMAVFVQLQGSKAASKENMEKYDEVLKWVAAMVKSGYVAETPHMTLGDIVMVASYATLKGLGSVDTRKYPFVEAWFQRCKQQILDYEKACGEGAVLFGSWYKQSKAANIRAA